MADADDIFSLRQKNRQRKAVSASFSLLLIFRSRGRISFLCIGKPQKIIDTDSIVVGKSDKISRRYLTPARLIMGIAYLSAVEYGCYMLLSKVAVLTKLPKSFCKYSIYQLRFHSLQDSIVIHIIIHHFFR